MLVIIVLLILALPLYANEDLKFDHQIRKSVQTYWHPCPIFCDWKWLKAQLKAESQFDPEAVSKSGALGIAQFMEPTWRELQDDGIIPKHVSRTDWKWSVVGAARYMGQLKHHPARPWANDSHRSKLQAAQASYNAGIGNYSKAWLACGADRHEQALVCLPYITGDDKASETTTYVARIERYYKEIN